MDEFQDCKLGDLEKPPCQVCGSSCRRKYCTWRCGNLQDAAANLGVPKDEVWATEKEVRKLMNIGFWAGFGAGSGAMAIIFVILRLWM